MHTKRLIIIGCGGHSKVVLDALRLSSNNYDIELWDDNPALANKIIAGIPVQAPISSYTQLNGFAHVAIGQNKARKKIIASIEANITLLTIIHPASVIASSADLSEGVFIAAKAILAPDCFIGQGSIINHAVVVDHDVKIGPYSHIGPNSTLGGNVSIGREVFVGAGATILPGITVGDGAIIGAGAVVTKHVLSNITVKGIPAR